MKKRKKVGIALSGGGARGLAHIGVLKVLQENHIPIDYIAGTSMGAVIGAFYSAELNIKKLEREVLDINWKDLFSYHFPVKGLMKSNKIEKFLRSKLGNITFDDLTIPLFITAFDIESKREIVFTKGDVVKAIRASISIPALFAPVSNKGRVLVDGGIVDPVPTEILKEKADIIIAVNVNKRRIREPILNEEAVSNERDKKTTVPNILACAAKSLQIFTSELSTADLIGDEIDFLINVNLEDVSALDFSDSQRIIKKGEQKAREVIEDIKATSKPNLFKDFLKELEEAFPVKILRPENLKLGFK
ncbi:patatin-like phospholipase family protein [Patescibacteria group bacterium]|nr:patatin-like phospholipase family protein [Patescibacteria group bacterium]